MRFEVLAISDAATISLWAVNLTVSLAISIILSRVAAVTRKFERLEDTREKEVDRLNSKLHDAATKLIDERFRAMTHELNNHVNGFSLALDAMKDRMRDGEQTFGELSDRDQRIELAVAAKFDVLKDFMRKELVTTEDLDGHEQRELERFTGFERQMRDMTAAIREGGGRHGG